MRTPIQLWLPFINRSFFDAPFSMDLQRAQKIWRGEHRIWLLQDLQKPVRWEINIGPFAFNETAIPSETFNVFSIVHIDKNGNCFPPVNDFFPDSWSGKIPKDLFKQWLNMTISIVPGKKEIEMLIPHIGNNQGEYKSASLKLAPGPVFELDKIDDEGKFSFHWPPEGDNTLPSISVIEENQRLKGPSQWDKSSSKDSPIGINGKRKRFYNTWLIGSEPFSKLFPTGIDMDTISQREKMKRCAIEKDIGEITSWIGKFTTEGLSTLEASWLAPALEAYGSESVLTDIEGKYNISHGSILNLLKDNDYNKFFRSPVSIRRCFGWLGYFWWELGEMLDNENIALCELCKNVISGKQGKKYCSKEENPDCFRSRRANDVRRFRKALKN